MNEEQMRILCPICRTEIQIKSEPRLEYSVPFHHGIITEQCSGSGLTTAYHAHGKQNSEQFSPPDAKAPVARLRHRVS